MGNSQFLCSEMMSGRCARLKLAGSDALFDDGKSVDGGRMG
jgi:hypothetical protein